MSAAPERGLRRSAYGSWAKARARCYDMSSDQYKYYGGRGISMCERWRQSFPAFLADMGQKPTAKHQIDRIDVNGNYEPGNVRWVTPQEQQSNRRDNRRVLVNGAEITLAAIPRRPDLSSNAVLRRVGRGWPIAEAVGTPPGSHRDRRRPPVGAGARLLDEWLIRRRLSGDTNGVHASGLGIDNSTLSKLARGRMRPGLAWRQRIAAYTHGAVPEDSWEMAEERVVML